MEDSQIKATNDLAATEILKKTFATFIQHFWPILIIVLVVALPTEFIKNYFFVPRDIEESMYRAMRRDGFVSMFFLSLITPSIIYYVHQKSWNDDISILRSLYVGLKKWPRIILYGFVTNVIIFAGLIFLIVPGVIFYFRLLFVDTIVTIEGTKGIDPIGKSRLYSKGILWKLISNVILLVIVTGISLFFASFFIYWFLEGWIADTIYDLIYQFATTLFTIQALLIYQVLKKRELQEPSH